MVSIAKSAYLCVNAYLSVSIKTFHPRYRTNLPSSYESPLNWFFSFHFHLSPCSNVTYSRWTLFLSAQVEKQISHAKLFVKVNAFSYNNNINVMAFVVHTILNINNTYKLSHIYGVNTFRMKFMNCCRS